MGNSFPLIKTTDEVYNYLKEGHLLSEKFNYSHPQKTDGKIKNISLGRIWLQLLLPDDYPLVDEIVNKKRLDQIIQDISKKYNKEITCNIVATLQEEAFKLTSIVPSSFNIKSLILPPEWLKEKEEFVKTASKLSPSEFDKKARELTQKLVDYLDRNNLGIQNVLKGGVKGDPIQDWSSLLVAKGYIVDIEGKLHGPITTGVAEGLSKTDYYISAAESRRLFYLKSIATQKPGLIKK